MKTIHLHKHIEGNGETWLIGRDHYDRALLAHLGKSAIQDYEVGDILDLADAHGWGIEIDNEAP